MTHAAYIALGSNQGDRELNMLRAVAEIGKLPGSKITALSSFYDTEPVGPEPQDDYLNAVLRLETPLSAIVLLAEMMRIECNVFKRVRTHHWGPRTMDLDILLYADRVIKTNDLTIPHPRFHERRFVLEPLVEIAPDVVHPLFGKTATELLTTVHDSSRVTKMEENC